MQLTVEEQEQFRRNGFIVRRGVFSGAEVEQMSAWLDQLSGSDGDGDAATYFETSPETGETVLVRAEHLLGEHAPEMTRLLLRDDVQATLAELLGDTPVLFKDKANYKLPGCRSDLLHQDQAAGWGAYADFFVTMLIAVDENRRDNAAVSFRAAADHRRTLLGPEWEVLSEAEPPFEPQSDYQLIEAQPGDVVYFDCYVPHGSPANTSDAARRNLYLTFNRAADGDRRMDYYRDKWANYPPNTRASARDRSSFKV